MRLLHTAGLYLKEFHSNIPSYAILSHTWDDGQEVLFQDMPISQIDDRTGFSKLRNCCKLALQQGYEWAWIDTCSIDKSSSAELSEAINSMFAWYQRAGVCLVYLADFDGEDAVALLTREKPRWFSRGWTLQELIAPPRVEFYNCNWIQIGTKDSLRMKISLITGIHEDALKGTHPSHYSVAERMSWAANRSTTRTEDLAYCLLGLFNVNMPLLYGEGERAFRRLQEEILKANEDYTIFAWGSEPNRPQGRTTGLLAPTPRCFVVDKRSSPFSSNLWGNPTSLTSNRALRRITNEPPLDALAKLQPPIITSRGIRLAAFLVKTGSTTLRVALYFTDAELKSLVCLNLEKCDNQTATFVRPLHNAFEIRYASDNELAAYSFTTIYAQVEPEVKRPGFLPGTLLPRSAGFYTRALFVIDGHLDKELHSTTLRKCSSQTHECRIHVALISLIVNEMDCFIMVGFGSPREDGKSWCRILPNDQVGTQLGRDVESMLEQLRLWHAKEELSDFDHRDVRPDTRLRVAVKDCPFPLAPRYTRKWGVTTHGASAVHIWSDPVAENGIELVNLEKRPKLRFDGKDI